MNHQLLLTIKTQQASKLHYKLEQTSNSYCVSAHSHVDSYSCTLWWKFRWQPHAAQRNAVVVPSSPSAMNSLQPSTAYPPMLAAWFFLHSAYLNTLLLMRCPPTNGSRLLTTNKRFFMPNFTLMHLLSPPNANV